MTDLLGVPLSSADDLRQEVARLRLLHSLTLEFNATEKKLKIYLDTDLQASDNVGSTTINTGETTALRVGQSVSFDVADSLSGSDAEGSFDGWIDWALGNGASLDSVYGAGSYPFPEASPSDSSTMRWLSMSVTRRWIASDTRRPAA